MTFRACLLISTRFLLPLSNPAEGISKQARAAQGCPVLEVGGWRRGHGISLPLRALNRCQQAGCCPSSAPTPALTDPSKDTHGNNRQPRKKCGRTETNWSPYLLLTHCVLALQHLKGCARRLPAPRAHTTLTKMMTMIADNMAGFKSHHFPMAVLATG